MQTQTSTGTALQATDLTTLVLAAARSRFGIQNLKLRTDGAQYWLDGVPGQAVAAPTLELLAQAVGVRKPRWLTPRQVAKKLGYKRIWLGRADLDRIKLPYHQASETNPRGIVILATDLEDWQVANPELAKKIKLMGNPDRRPSTQRSKTMTGRKVVRNVTTRPRPAPVAGTATDLLAKAREYDTAHGRVRSRSVGLVAAQLPLILAYCRGELTASAVATVLRCRVNAVQNAVRKVLQAAVVNGLLVESGTGGS